MATTNYISMDGMIIGEETAGVMRNYGTDALGSVVETVLNGVAENSYQYKPYGGILAKIGAAVDPSFLWNGGSGYRATKLTNSEYYVRWQHYSSTMSDGLTTVSRAWPVQPAYTLPGSHPNAGGPPPSSYTLSMVGPTKLNNASCGAAGICGCLWEWGLDPLPYWLNGWIVQQVNYVISAWVSCSQFAKSVSNQFWEAWQVQNGVIYCGPAPNWPTPGLEQQSYSLNNPTVCTHMVVGAVSKAKFFKDLNLVGFQYVPRGQNAVVRSPCPGLMVSTTAPNFWSIDDSNAVNYSWSLVINCCKPAAMTPCANPNAPQTMTCTTGCDSKT